MVKEDIICKKISVIDLVHNHTIALECELKVVSKMPSMKRPAVVFARAADIISKQVPLESVLVHVPGIQMVVVVIALDTARSGEILCFACNNGDQD